MRWLPADRVYVDNPAWALLIGQLPSVLVPSMKVTLPVAPAVTVAVNPT